MKPRRCEKLLQRRSRIFSSGKKAMQQIGCPELIVVLQDQRKDPEVRKNAAKALGKIKDPRAVEPLIATLKDKDSDVRWHAARALEKIQDPRAVEPLIATLKDKDSEVRWHAAEALEKITKEHFGREVAKWEEWLKKQKAGE